MLVSLSASIRFARLGAFFLLATAFSADAARADNLDGLLAALASAKGGETIVLAGGDYGKLELIHGRVDATFPSEVTITAADPNDPPVFSGVDIRGAANLTFDGVVFDYTFREGHPIFHKPFYFEGVENVTIRNSVVDGDLARGVSAEDDGLGWAQGLNFRGGSNITVENVEITDFYRGLVMGGIDDAVVRNNDLHGLRMDGMNFVGMQGAVIEGNHIHDFNRSSLASDHADMIQFWTNGSTRPSTDIVIRGNVLDIGAGDSTQSIFMRNDMVDRGLAGQEMFYRNITIEENVIINGHAHGITVGETNGLIIRNNTLLRHQRYAAGDNREKQVRIPRISVAAASVSVTITDNIVARFPDPRPGWQVEGNLSVQDISPMQPGYYHRLFVAALTDDPGDLESFVYLPEVGAARPPGGWPGAALLQPEADRSAFQ